MHIEYHKWFSPILGHDMEMKVYGYFGKPVLVFPAQAGSFHEFEDFGMIDKLSPFIEFGADQGLHGQQPGRADLVELGGAPRRPRPPPPGL